MSRSSPTANPYAAHTDARRPDLASRMPQPSHSLATLTNNVPLNIPARLATTPLKAIPYRDPRPLKRLGSISHINSYNSPHAIQLTPRAPSLTNSDTPRTPLINIQPNNSMQPEAKPTSIAYRAHCLDILVTNRRPTHRYTHPPHTPIDTPQSTGPLAASPSPS